MRQTIITVTTMTMTTMTGLVLDYHLVTCVFSWNQYTLYSSGIVLSSFIHCNVMAKTKNNNNNSDRTMPNQQQNKHHTNTNLSGCFASWWQVRSTECLEPNHTMSSSSSATIIMTTQGEQLSWQEQ